MASAFPARTGPVESKLTATRSKIFARMIVVGATVTISTESETMERTVRGLSRRQLGMHLANFANQILKL